MSDDEVFSLKDFDNFSNWYRSGKVSRKVKFMETVNSEHKWASRRMRRAKQIYDHPKIKTHMVATQKKLQETLSAEWSDGEIIVAQTDPPWRYRRIEWDEDTCAVFMRVGILHYKTINRSGDKKFRVSSEFVSRMELTHSDKLSVVEAVDALSMCLTDYEQFYKSWSNDAILREAVSENAEIH